MSTQTGGERADDGANGVGGINTAHQTRGILSRRGHGGQRQRETRAPKAGRGQDGPETTREIKLKTDPGVPDDDGSIGQ